MQTFIDRCMEQGREQGRQQGSAGERGPLRV
jgi:hypothetical protein